MGNHSLKTVISTEPLRSIEASHNVLDPFMTYPSSISSICCGFVVQQVVQQAASRTDCCTTNPQQMEVMELWLITQL